jgi:hypothetical protein
VAKEERRVGAKKHKDKDKDKENRQPKDLFCLISFQSMQARRFIGSVLLIDAVLVLSRITACHVNSKQRGWECGIFLYLQTFAQDAPDG